MPPPTPIAIAVVELDDRYLVGQRPEGKPLAGYWEFPGGRVDAGELPEDAAIRECWEETGLRIEIVGIYPNVVHDYAHDRVKLHFFACRPQPPIGGLCAPFQWVTRETLATLQFPEANRELIDQIVSGVEAGRNTEAQRAQSTEQPAPLRELRDSVFNPKAMSVNELTHAIIGAAIEVHKRLGPGLLESAYRACLAYELRKRGFTVVEEKPVPVIYDDIKLDCGFRADLLVNGEVVVELKAKSALHPVDHAQTLSHLRLLGLRYGLLINFHEERLVDGVHRIVNGY